MPGWLKVSLLVVAIATAVALVTKGATHLSTLGEHRGQPRQDFRGKVPSDEDLFATFPRSIRVEAHKDVGFVHHEHAGGYLIQLQQPLPSNTSITRVPYRAVLDAVSACGIVPNMCAAFTEESNTIQSLLFPNGTSPTSDAVSRAFGHLKVLMALLYLREGFTSKNGSTHLLEPWIRAVVSDEPAASDLRLAPEVASKCLDKADYSEWQHASRRLSRERHAILHVFIHAGLTVNTTLDDVAWASTVVRRRAWIRPPPYFVALVPLLDLNDLRVGNGAKPAIRADRRVTATAVFDDASKRVHLVLMQSLGRGAYPVVRGDDDDSSPLTAPDTVRRYGFFDSSISVVPSFAGALFSDLAAESGCRNERLLFFNSTSAEPSPLLVSCVHQLTGKSASAARKFLSVHASRAAQELYNPSSMFACEGIVKRREKHSLRAVEQAEMRLQAFKHTRNALLAVSELLKSGEIPR